MSLKICYLRRSRLYFKYYFIWYIFIPFIEASISREIGVSPPIPYIYRSFYKILFLVLTWNKQPYFLRLTISELNGQCSEIPRCILILSSSTSMLSSRTLNVYHGLGERNIFPVFLISLPSPWKSMGFRCSIPPYGC